MEIIRNKAGLFWTLAFVLVFLFLQDYLYLKWSPSATLLGLPSWLFWFAGIHLLFILLFYFFSKNFWKEH